MDANLPENKGKIRPIGVIEQSECHIIQIKGLSKRLTVSFGWRKRRTCYVCSCNWWNKETIAPYTVPGNQYTPDSALALESFSP